ncbi:ABC transporter permease subunit [Tessaracoccus antarcticus]|uniref:ABC transporter permease n=1 Tax=Tessaracoccus antarcticus TaxID=2479848 RepID=A0A3M0FXK9_9ACTN|nr:ABC transporter permease subunit [Tessaracoccus antarcticus]RMB57480.1 ABC transporter permease [Tessaracoccus antarcticus]
MNTAVTSRGTATLGDKRISFAGVLRSEFIKLTSLRANMGLLLAIMVSGMVVNLALALTMGDAGLPSEPSIPFMLDQVTVGTVLFGQLLAGVLGVIVMAGEYSSGTVHSTLVAVPSRVTVLAAKAVVVFVTVTAVGLVTLVGSWAASYPMYAAFGLGIGLAAPGVALALLSGASYLGFSAVLGLGIGTLLRSVAAGVATVISVILLLPLVLSVLPVSPLIRELHLLTMSKAGDAMVSVADPSAGLMNLADGYLSPTAGWLVAVAWSGVFLVVGAIRLVRKDA